MLTKANTEHFLSSHILSKTKFKHFSRTIKEHNDFFPGPFQTKATFQYITILQCQSRCRFFIEDFLSTFSKNFK